MDVRCDKCQARYRIDDARVGPAGLTMRCGKCGNTFKVTKDGVASKPPPAAAPADAPGSTMMFQAPKIAPAAAPKPAPSAAASDDAAGSTMMFQAPKIAPAAAPKPAPSAPPAAAKPAPAAAKPDDAAGATMMFVAPKPKPAPAPAPKPSAADEDSGSTMVFGSAPVKITEPDNPPVSKPAPAAAKPAPAAARPSDDAAGSTMMFGSSPIAKPPPPAAPKPPPKPEPRPEPKPEPVAAAEEPELPRGDEETANEAPEAKSRHEEDTASGAGEPAQARPGEAVGEDDIDPSALTAESSAAMEHEGSGPPPSAREKKPFPVLPVAIGGGAVALLAIVGVVVMKMRPHPPPPAAIQAMNDARATYEKDSLAAIADALQADQAAIAAAPKSIFPEAHALQAEIELAWSDALADEAQLLSDKAGRTDDDKKKTDIQAQSDKAQAEAKTHLKASFDAAKAAAATSPQSPEVHLALADYYRAGNSSANCDKEMKKAAALKAADERLAEIEGAKLMGDPDTADKALAKLKTAQAANPQSARIAYRIAQVQLALKNDAEEKKALEAVLKLSPQHERAKLMLEALAAAQPPPPPADDGGGDANK